MGITNLVNGSVDIQSETQSQSGIGGTSNTWNTTASGVSAKIAPLDGDSIIAYARQGFTCTDAIYFASDASLTPNRSRIVADGLTYYVRLYQHFKGGSLEHWKAIVERKP